MTSAGGPSSPESALALSPPPPESAASAPPPESPGAESVPLSPDGVPFSIGGATVHFACVHTLAMQSSFLRHASPACRRESSHPYVPPRHITITTNADTARLRD